MRISLTKTDTACCDNGSHRFAFGAISAIPTDGAAIITTTNGQMVAVRETEADGLTRQVLIPAKLAPTKLHSKRATGDDVVAEVDGEFRNAVGVVASEVEGRYPEIGRAMCDVAGKTVVVVLNATLLHQLAKSIGDSGNVALVLDTTPDKKTGYATNQIRVVGDRGIGAMMPAGLLEDATTATAACQRYTSLLNRLRKFEPAARDSREEWLDLKAKRETEKSQADYRQSVAR